MHETDPRRMFCAALTKAVQSHGASITVEPQDVHIVTAYHPNNVECMVSVDGQYVDRTGNAQYFETTTYYWHIPDQTYAIVGTRLTVGPRLTVGRPNCNVREEIQDMGFIQTTAFAIAAAARKVAYQSSAFVV